MKLTKYQWIQWLLLIASVRFFFITGTKIITFTGQEWNYFFHNFHFPPTEAKTAFGGFIVAIVGFCIAKIWLRYKFKALDAYAMVIPIGMAIQRVGCLLIGCCSGNTTLLPWAFHYGKFSPAFYHQVQSGIIDESTIHAIGVHPIPLYIILYCLLICLLVWKYSKYFKAPGNQTLFSVLLVFTARFIVEFLRNSFTNHTLGSMFFGLKLIQWCLLALICILTLILVLREKYYHKNITYYSKSSPNFLASISFILFLSLIIYSGKNWFVPIEKISLIFIIIPATLFLLWHLFQQLLATGFRLTVVVLMVLSFLIMSQTIIESEVPDSASNFVPEAWNSFGIGYGLGSYEDIDYGCEGNIIDRTKIYYNIGRAEYNRYFRLKEKHLGTIGIRGFYGKTTSQKEYLERTLYDINPYFKYDFRKIGLGIGFHHGQLNYNNSSEYDEKEFYPMIYLRKGSLDKAFLELYVFDNSLLYTPTSTYRFGLGIYLGKEFNTLHFGMTEVCDQSGLYFIGNFLLHDDFLIEPNISLQLGDGSGIQGGLGVHYFFGRSPIIKKKKY
jgi:phosphatidylglycerol:prolipoprotein diacylglycerol transferase